MALCRVYGARWYGFRRRAPAERRTESQDHGQPGIFDVVADLFSVPGPIAVARLSTGQSGRRGAPPWRPPRRGTEAPRPRSRVAVLAPLIHISTHFHSNGSATKRERDAGPKHRVNSEISEAPRSRVLSVFKAPWCGFGRRAPECGTSAENESGRTPRSYRLLKSSGPLCRHGQNSDPLHFRGVPAVRSHNRRCFGCAAVEASCLSTAR
jgi:hypothetical protein